MPELGLSTSNGLLMSPTTPQTSSTTRAAAAANSVMKGGLESPADAYTQANGDRQHSPYLQPSGSESPFLRSSQWDIQNADLSDHSWQSSGGGGGGRSGAAGKSGRVIERLMAENDRKEREMRLLQAKAEEDGKMRESMRSTVESLRATNQNLEAICDANQTALARRDRKIEQLREDLTTEVARREHAERTQREVVESTNASIDTLQRHLDATKERAGFATAQYDAVRDSVKHLKGDFQGKVAKLSSEARLLLREREEDQARFDALDKLCGRLRAELDRAHQTNRELQAKYEEHQHAVDTAFERYAKRVDEAEGRCDTTREEMQETLGRMKQVMIVKKTFKGEFKE